MNRFSDPSIMMLLSKWVWSSSTAGSYRKTYAFSRQYSAAREVFFPCPNTKYQVVFCYITFIYYFFSINYETTLGNIFPSECREKLSFFYSHCLSWSRYFSQKKVDLKKWTFFTTFFKTKIHEYKGVLSTSVFAYKLSGIEYFPLETVNMRPFIMPKHSLFFNFIRNNFYDRSICVISLSTCFWETKSTTSSIYSPYSFSTKPKCLKIKQWGLF